MKATHTTSILSTHENTHGMGAVPARSGGVTALKMDATGIRHVRFFSNGFE
jgi:hypothetical protein